MAVWTPTGLVVRKSATECSQLLIPKGSLSGDELRKPAPASLPLSWSFPLVLVLTRQSAASGKPLSAPFCLEKTSIHSRELMSVLPDDPSPGCLVLQSFSRNNGHRENGLFPKLHHWYHLTAPTASQNPSEHCSLLPASLLPSVWPCTVFTRKYYCHPPSAIYRQSQTYSTLHKINVIQSIEPLSTLPSALLIQLKLLFQGM